MQLLMKRYNHFSSRFLRETQVVTRQCYCLAIRNVPACNTNQSIVEFSILHVTKPLHSKSILSIQGPHFFPFPPVLVASDQLRQV